MKTDEHTQAPAMAGTALDLRAPEKPDVGFVACIERGTLEKQALLLCESIRLYTGRFRGCAIYLLTPRAGPKISRGARQRLDELGVHYSDAILNTECTEYGPANRVAAAAHVEETSRHDTLVILDSDTMFLREPSELSLPPGIDVAARPVDVKGMCTGGPQDSFDPYWRELCRSCGVDYDAIPWSESFVDHQRIKATCNGGLVVVRRSLGVMRRSADFFFTSVRNGLRPRADASPFRAGEGLVKSPAARWWGSSQAALTLAIWSTTRKVRQLSPTYNYPLHLHDRIRPMIVRNVFPHLVHVHYHWLFAKDALKTNPLFLASGPLSDGQRDWLRSATPIA